MTILPDGRWRLSGPEINAKVWEKIKNWVLQPDGRHMVPNFPPCRVRTLVATCLPCGKLSSLNYKPTAKNVRQRGRTKLNEPLKLPRRELLPTTLLEYGFPESKPIFWGPNQRNEDEKYKEPVGWKFNETLSVPYVVRFIHDDTTVDSDTADNTDGNPDPGEPGDNPWTLYDQACYVDISTCSTSSCENEYIHPAPNCGPGTRTWVEIWDKTGMELCCCTSFYTGGLPTIPSGYSYYGGYLVQPATGGSPLFNPSTAIVLALSQVCSVDDPGTSLWVCPRILAGDHIYSGSIAGACAAHYMFHMRSITTWFWKRTTTSGPDPFEYTYTSWVNQRWLNEEQTVPDSDFIDMQWCYPGQPLYPTIP